MKLTKFTQLTCSALCLAITLTLGAPALTANAHESAEEHDGLHPPRLDALPDNLLALSEARNRFLMSLPRSANGVSPYELIVEQGLLWVPGETVTIAFKGGSAELHKDIAEAAREWTKHANLTFDFGYNPQTGQYRSWSETDTRYSADIRISFDRGGYWSQVGTDSSNPFTSRPNWASMNLGGFDRFRPADWVGTVIHEFGHAIGSHHMHQHPSEGCDGEWRWNNDTNYIRTHLDGDSRKPLIRDRAGRYPGLYDYLGGPFNEWPKHKVDHNLRQLANTTAYRSAEFDSESIMLYAFDSWMFINGTNSPCFIGRRPNALSTQDKTAIARFYPSGREVSAIIENRKNDIIALREDSNILSALEKNGAGLEFLAIPGSPLK